MSKVTRFSGSDPGSTARVSGFIAHLREHGFHLGVAETETALRALSCVNPIVPSEARLALKSVCAGSVEDSVQFDKLFDSFWMADGRVRHKVIQTKATAKLKDTKTPAQMKPKASPARDPSRRPRMRKMVKTATQRALAS